MIPEARDTLDHARAEDREAETLLKLAQVCRRLNCDRKTVYKLIEAKLLPCSRIPGLGRRFEPADVEALITNHRIA